MGVRRADWLRELHALLLAAVVVSGIVGLANALITLTGQPVSIPVRSGSVLPAGAVPGVVIDGDADLFLRVDHPTTGQLVLATLADLPGYLLVTAMLVLLWRLVGRARRDDPFTDGTARRLTVLGWLLIVGGPVVCTVEFLARFVLSGSVGDGRNAATLDVGAAAAWLLVGVGMLAIGQVVRRGQTLRAELDGVV
jgi:hypothetical protein